MNYYQNGYQPTGGLNAPIVPPTGGSVMQPADTQRTNSNMFWVQGEAGAKSYPVVPGNHIALWDSESQTIYIKTVDSSGIPQPLRILDYTERAPVSESNASYLTEDRFNELLDEKLEAFASRLNQRNSYQKKGGKQNVHGQAQPSI